MRAVLLDRDGTINRKAPEGEYVTRVEELELLPGASAAVGRLTRAGLPVAVVTNQRGIALGRMTEADLEAIHSALAQALAADGGQVQVWLHCPHERGSCACRKPAPGMLLEALDRFGVEPRDAVMIGDAASDVEAGRNAGTMTIRLGEADAGDPQPPPARLATDLAAAVDSILS